MFGLGVFKLKSVTITCLIKQQQCHAVLLNFRLTSKRGSNPLRQLPSLATHVSKFELSNSKITKVGPFDKSAFLGAYVLLWNSDGCWNEFESLGCKIESVEYNMSLVQQGLVMNISCNIIRVDRGQLPGQTVEMIAK